MYCRRLITPIDLIMLCVSTVSYQICFNGELTERFDPQGGPLSPYLFVLCIEKLSHLIADAVNRNVWKPVKTSPGISHLFFADDLILFAEASQLEFSRDRFCDFSGHFEKSMIYCSSNTCNDVAREISAICGSLLTDNLEKFGITEKESIVKGIQR